MTHAENRNNYPYERKKSRAWMIGGLVAVLLIVIALFSMNRTDNVSELSPAAGQASMMEDTLNPSVPQNSDMTTQTAP